MTRRPGEGGSASVELVVLTPVMAVLLLFMVAFGRLTVANQEIGGAAADAARAASVASSPDEAWRAARGSAQADLSSDGLSCASLGVSVDTAEFVPGGTVAVRLTCVDDFSAFALLRIPGTQTLSAAARAPVDQYRTVSP